MDDSLRERLGYAFRNPDLLRGALTHRSFGASNNERLEFVGDAVLNCVVAASLYQRFPALAEGDLSRARAALVNQDMLARVARGAGLGSEIRLGEGEHKTGGAARPSILADALEAVFGAIFLDGGYTAARRAVVQAFGAQLAQLDPGAVEKDAKTRLQELLHSRGLQPPAYRVIATHGAPHQRSFDVECAAGELTTMGRGSSRQRAEQEAAATMLEKLQ